MRQHSNGAASFVSLCLELESPTDQGPMVGVGYGREGGLAVTGIPPQESKSQQQPATTELILEPVNHSSGVILSCDRLRAGASFFLYSSTYFVCRNDASTILQVHDFVWELVPSAKLSFEIPSDPRHISNFS